MGMIIWGLAVAATLGLVLLYNSMVRGKNAAEEAWSGIDVQLRRRHDLIPNLVSVVNRYAAHEKDIFERVSELRAQSLAAGNDVAATAQAENALSSALRSIFAVAEDYPDLQANENFLDLQDKLHVMEDEIQMARRYYNGVAREQNNRVLQFPGLFLARSFGFLTVPYFELDDVAQRQVPQVDSLLK